MPTRRYVTLREAADYAGVHYQTIRNWIKAGRLTAYHQGPQIIKVSLDDLDAMFQPVEVTV